MCRKTFSPGCRCCTSNVFFNRWESLAAPAGASLPANTTVAICGAAPDWYEAFPAAIGNGTRTIRFGDVVPNAAGVPEIWFAAVGGIGVPANNDVYVYSWNLKTRVRTQRFIFDLTPTEAFIDLTFRVLGFGELGVQVRGILVVQAQFTLQRPNAWFVCSGDGSSLSFSGGRTNEIGFNKCEFSSMTPGQVTTGTRSNNGGAYAATYRGGGYFGDIGTVALDFGAGVTSVAPRGDVTEAAGGLVIGARTYQVPGYVGQFGEPTPPWFNPLNLTATSKRVFAYFTDGNGANIQRRILLPEGRGPEVNYGVHRDPATGRIYFLNFKGTVSGSSRNMAIYSWSPDAQPAGQDAVVELRCEPSLANNQGFLTPNYTGLISLPQREWAN